MGCVKPHFRDYMYTPSLSAALPHSPTQSTIDLTCFPIHIPPTYIPVNNNNTKMYITTTTTIPSHFLSIVTTTIIIISISSGAAFAQTGSQNSSIPSCIRPCDTVAIAASNCTATDQYCHCLKAETILEELIPCVPASCGSGDDGTADLVCT